MKNFLLSIILAVVVAVMPQASENNPKAMIIFDASGSMWGQIDGINKIVIARDALKEVVRKWNPKVELGLTAYGHRVKGDCEDIQTIIPIGKLNRKQMIDTVLSINPKGMTPIAKSLRKVANSLRQYEDTTTIILISDGKESCEADPCATAKQLKAEGINFVAHVVGFNVDAKTDRQLSCIASATGGEYFSAKNAAALTKAIKVIAKKVEKAKPKPVIKKLKHNLELSSSETKGGKWIESHHSVYKVEGGEVGDSSVISSNSHKKRAVLALLPAGKYMVKSTHNAFKVETPFEVTSKKVTKLHIIMGSTGQVAITASETADGKWVEARIGNSLNEEGEDASIGTYATYKKKANIARLPVGKYTLTDVTYNGYKKKSVPFEIKAGEVTKLNIVFGLTGQVAITASETADGKWVEARIGNSLNEEGEDASIGTYATYKKKANIARLPVGKYTLTDVTYNGYKKKSVPFEIKAGEVTKLHIIMGSTGKTEVTASEKDGGKWVDAACYAYKIIDGEVDKSDYWSMHPRKKKAGTKQLPVGKYTLECKYNAFKKNTSFEIKAGKVTKIHVTMGQTSTVEISTSETDGGKWVKAGGSLHKKDGDRLDGFRTGKSKPAKYQLAVGKYYVNMEYNSIKKKVSFEAKAGEITKVHIVMGQTGVVSSTASEKAGGRWVRAGGYVYPLDSDGEKGSWIAQIITGKSQADTDILPEGKYLVELKYKNFQKDIIFDIKAGETTKLHAVFGQFIISAKCTDTNAKVNYEVYASNGRLVYEKRAKCSETISITLDSGDYAVEAKVGSVTKEMKFTVGGDSNSLNINMMGSSKEELIKADKQANIQISKPKNSLEELGKVVDALNQVGVELSEKDTADIKQAGAFLEALGGMMGGKQTAEQKDAKKQAKAKKESDNAKADKEFEDMSKELDMFTK